MHVTEGSVDYVTHVHRDIDEIDPTVWDDLVRAEAGSPFLLHAWLKALHDSGSATPRTGWTPRFITLYRNGTLEGGCALYFKDHSYGEYVFDWAWADAYERHGLAYYPKVLGAIPFTPVPGPRLLARSEAARRALLISVETLARRHGLSSAHLLFLAEPDRQSAQAQGWLLRSTVQFHWFNRRPRGYVDFEDFLGALQREKRKKIQQERRRVAESGISFQVLRGDEIEEQHWNLFYDCYCATYRAHGSMPYLTREFFDLTARQVATHWLLFIARQGTRPIASSLIALDPDRRRAFGRYWGALEYVSCLHFEACYYQPLQWCIANGYDAFEGGAQGEHKMARGLMPVRTWSAHWLSHPAFADAVSSFLDREGQGVDAYVNELDEHSPFKRTQAPPR